MGPDALSWTTFPLIVVVTVPSEPEPLPTFVAEPATTDVPVGASKLHTRFSMAAPLAVAEAMSRSTVKVPPGRTVPGAVPVTFIV